MTSAVDLEALPRLMRLVHRVPMHMRRFTVPQRLAKSHHRITPELADVLVAEGLPHVGTGEHRLFDDYDLGNLALHLGLVSVRRMTMRSWANSLNRNSELADPAVRVGVLPRCPVPPHDGPCQFQLLRENGHREPVTALPDGRDPVAHYDIRLTSAWPELAQAARELADEVADLDFFLLPEAIRWDHEFTMRARIADCGSVADWLVREGERRGLQVRFAFGLLVVKPYSTPHCWAEFRTDGVWVPYDPLLLDAMRRWAGLDRERWHPYRSIGPVLHRLCGHFTKVASHDGAWAPISLPTDYVSEETP
ncbi:MAG TPA: transglutaminase domain-containing protein [Actinophytocola sp.]|uniref:transglutaminase domain-containing protein n=1 Tax=Actinophytocola sp. TaxID=1872138 RepID=UPI002DBDF770|nr:transglutaminase domain-containing protein [Actinophytocola sp.]HEU5473555.1 transglutaminase domain-containing protein [Actinophytocola sp.]